MSSRHLMPRLLSGRNSLSRVEKDRILERVLAEVAPARRFAPRPLHWVGAAAAVAGLVLVAAILTRDGREPELAARGGAAAVAGLAVSCPGSPSGACRPASTMVFDLSRSGGYRYFAAFGRRSDGTVLWYFPVAGGRSVDLEAGLRDGLLDRGVRLGADHPPGRYRIHGIFSVEPLDREAIRARFRPGAEDLGPGTAVVVTDLVVEEVRQ